MTSRVSRVSGFTRMARISFDGLGAANGEATAMVMAQSARMALVNCILASVRKVNVLLRGRYSLTVFRRWLLIELCCGTALFEKVGFNWDERPLYTHSRPALTKSTNSSSSLCSKCCRPLTARHCPDQIPSDVASRDVNRFFSYSSRISYLESF